MRSHELALNLPPIYDVNLWLCSDEEITMHNLEYRKINKSTDVLSFPSSFFHQDDAPSVETSTDPSYSAFLAESKILGDILISVPYVNRQIELDKKEQLIDPNHSQHDGGVSKLMSAMYTFEERLPLLLIHSLLHLRGYDHERSEDDWKLQCARELEFVELLDLAE